jgi:hypothetical protein
MQCPLLAHSGLFEQARNRSAIGGEADIARDGSTSYALGDFEVMTKERLNRVGEGERGHELQSTAKEPI